MFQRVTGRATVPIEFRGGRIFFLMTESVQWSNGKLALNETACD